MIHDVYECEITDPLTGRTVRRMVRGGNEAGLDRLRETAEARGLFFNARLRQLED